MKDLQIFNSPRFGEIRTVVSDDGQPLFCLTDLYQSLGLETNNTIRRLSDGVCSKHPLQTRGGVQQANFVNEDGLYDVILDSRKPEARAFRKWITSEVLPAIRKSGGYMVARIDETPEELVARALVIANETVIRQQKRIALLQSENQQKQLTIETQELEIAESAPKVNYYDSVLQSTSAYTVTQIAKEFGWGAVTLNRRLHELGIQYRLNGQWLLYSRYADRGFTRTSTVTYTNSQGLQSTVQHTLWTEKGREFIHRIINNLK